MPRKSSIRALSTELRRELDRLLGEGRHTHKEVAEHLRSMGAQVSKSAVGRYSQDYERVMKDIRLSREMALAISKDLEDTTGADPSRLVIESLQALLMRARMQLADADEIDIEQLGYLSRSVKDLAGALKTNVETEIRIRDRVTKEAAAAAEKVAVSAGLSVATVESIKASILGVGAPK